MAGQGFFHQESSVKTLNPFKVILSEYNLDCMFEVSKLVPLLVVQVTDALVLDEIKVKIRQNLSSR